MYTNLENLIYLSSKPSVCRVCGDMARGNNFQVPTCMSCKSFFRRNALLPSGTFHCLAGNTCLITKKTRNHCQACRLRKCFESGMNPKLIQQINNQRIIHTNIRVENNPYPSEINSNLFQEYSSDINLQQMFFSNLFDIFHQTKLKKQCKNTSTDLSSLPPKLRFKSARKFHLMNTVFNTILEQSYDFTNPYDALIKN